MNESPHHILVIHENRSPYLAQMGPWSETGSKVKQPLTDQMGGLPSCYF